ncbi:MAG: hypothetical protein JWP02_3689 [Acidimicrobiales bacterium]|nr:hypothetical protein [Acidimicrobiales bacterium]
MADDDVHDELPEELDVTGYVGQYTFPDIARRRIPAVIYLAVAGFCFLLWVTHRGPGHVLVNDGFGWVAAGLALVGLHHWAAAWPLNVRETDALVAASLRVGFPIGHASAQLGWGGLRSRPVWRILLYSAEDPPRQRGVVAVDAVDGRVLFDFVEANPEDWSSLNR